MTHLGLGVLIRQLFGSHAFDASKIVGVKISGVTVGDDTLTITFADGAVLKLSDKGQSCCEHRYMVCDDKLDEFVDATIEGIALEDGPNQCDEYGEEHEVQFLRITTSKGVIVVSNHNEHNGYYGGFSIEADYEPRRDGGTQEIDE